MEDHYRTLSAIMVGHSLADTVAVAFATYIAVTQWNAGGITAATAALVIAVLVLSGVLAKNGARAHAEEFILAFSGMLSVTVTVFSPLAFLFGLRGASSSPAGTEGKRSVITEEELKSIIEESQDEGVLEQQESELAQSALDFDEIHVGEILTPRVDVVALEINMTLTEMRDVILEEKFTRLPVYEDTLDNVVGILHERDFLSSLVLGKNFQIRSLIKEPMFIPDSIKLSKALAHMQKNKTQIAVVTDEHGGTVGIVTMEDILEELVGEIWDEHDEILEMLEVLSPHRYHVNGNMNIDDFLEEIHYEGEEIHTRSNSVGGWASEMLGKIPQPGEKFGFGGLKVTISQVEDNRVAQLTVEYDVG